MTRRRSPRAAPATTSPRSEHERHQVAIRELTPDETKHLAEPELAGPAPAKLIAEKCREYSALRPLLDRTFDKLSSTLDRAVNAANKLVELLGSDVIRFSDQQPAAPGAMKFAVLREAAASIADTLRSHPLRRSLPSHRPPDLDARDLALEVAYILRNRGALERGRLRRVLEVVLFENADGDPTTYVRHAAKCIAAGELPLVAAVLASQRASLRRRRQGLKGASKE